MPKPLDTLTQLATKLIRTETHQVCRQAGLKSHLGKSASRAVTPLLLSNPLAKAQMAINSRATSAGVSALSRLGAVRNYSKDLPPTSLITRYKPVLEDAVEKHQEMIELVEQDNFCLPSFVTIALNIIPGVSSIRLDNGYTITGIEQVRSIENSTAKCYELKVTSPDTLDRQASEFSIPVTVFKANVIAHPRPSNLKTLMGLCTTALGFHYGDLPEELHSSVKVFSTTFLDLEPLYSSFEVLSDLIQTGYLSTPSALFDSMNIRLKANGLKPDNEFVKPLKQMLIEKFKSKHPGHDEEIDLLMKLDQRPAEKVFKHSIAHKGGAYRAAFKLNLLAKATPHKSFSFTCIQGNAPQKEQSFTLHYHPSGHWLKSGRNPETGHFESKTFARADQLSEALKEHKVKSILSTQSLGLL